MMVVNVHEAKTHLSRLLKRVTAGEEITIARDGVPVAKLIALVPAGGRRPLGMDRGTLWIADDFDAPDPALEALFHAPIDLGPPLKKPASAKKSSKKKRA